MIRAADLLEAIDLLEKDRVITEEDLYRFSIYDQICENTGKAWDWFDVDILKPWAHNDSHLRPANIKKLLSPFIPGLWEYIFVGVLKIMDETEYYISEGHKRWMATKKIGLKRIRGYPIELDYVEQLGELYEKIAKAKMRKTGNSMYKNGVGMKNPFFSHMDSIVTANGFHVCDFGVKVDNGIRSAKTLEYIVIGSGPGAVYLHSHYLNPETYVWDEDEPIPLGFQVLNTILYILRKAYGGVHESTEKIFLVSLAQFLLHHGIHNPDLRVEALINQLRRMGTNTDGFGDPQKLHVFLKDPDQTNVDDNPGENRSQAQQERVAKEKALISLTTIHNRDRSVTTPLPIPRRKK